MYTPRMVGALCAAVIPFLLSGQSMELTSGSLTVAGGTQIVVASPLVWHIAEGAIVVNDGLIDLGTTGELDEAEGWPITGAGTEKATRSFPAAFGMTEPGGLGLELSGASGIGECVITRGHQPFTVSGTESIARWFLIEAAPQEGAAIDVRFRYDPTELNGLDGTALMLHASAAPWAPWTPLNGTNLPAQYMLTAPYPSPWHLVTAFDQDIPMGMYDADAIPTFVVRPTVTDGPVHIDVNGTEVLRSVRLLDTAGRLVRSVGPSGDTVGMVVDLSPLPSGMYVLLLNGIHSYRIVKP